ncbi:MAG: glycoside hydrolase family 47 protein [Terricaulis sp.]
MTHALDRRAVLGAGAALAACATEQSTHRDWKALAVDVQTQMAWAFSQYREKAWGKDEIKPVSGAYSSLPLRDHHVGLTLVEALDTLWAMGLDEEFNAGVEWVKRELNFDVDGDVSVFETNIRLVGGLLSAHHASGDPVLLAKAKDLADRLLPAFDTPSGIPWGKINLRSGTPSEPRNSPAGAGTYMAEFGTLSRLTGDARYVRAAKRAMVALFDQRSAIGLLATQIHGPEGRWLSRTATVGSYGDSYYETLWDAWDLLGDADCRRMYDACTASILAHQREVRDGDLWFPDLDFETGAILSRRQDELASFYGGLLTQGGNAREGAAYMLAWAKVQDRFGVLPEEYDYAAKTATQVTNSLRPELADSCFNIWLIDRDERWREIAAKHFDAMKRWNKAAYGYTDMADVTAEPKRQADHCPGYWWSEQMKYYWLIFSDTPRFDYRRSYLSTEGNVLRGFRRN